jgi:hypothetical protein
MKTITLTLFAAALAIAQSNSSATTGAKDSKTADQSKKQKPAASKAAAHKPPLKAEPPVTAIPAGATQVEPNLYRMTDSNGKTWNYRQTPFGINKWEQTSTPEAAPVPEPVPQSTQGSLRSSQVKTEPIAVTDLGDSYRFDKNTPFGHSTWVRKKSEVTAKERAIIEGRDTQSAPDTAGNAGKPAGN